MSELLAALLRAYEAVTLRIDAGTRWLGLHSKVIEARERIAQDLAFSDEDIDDDSEAWSSDDNEDLMSNDGVVDSARRDDSEGSAQEDEAVTSEEDFSTPYDAERTDEEYGVAADDYIEEDDQADQADEATALSGWNHVSMALSNTLCTTEGATNASPDGAGFDHEVSELWTDGETQQLPQQPDARPEADSSATGTSAVAHRRRQRRHAYRMRQQLLTAKALTEQLSSWQLAELADVVEGAPPPAWLTELEAEAMGYGGGWNADEAAAAGAVALDVEDSDEDEEEQEQARRTRVVTVQPR